MGYSDRTSTETSSLSIDGIHVIMFSVPSSNVQLYEWITATITIILTIPLLPPPVMCVCWRSGYDRAVVRSCTAWS